MELFTKKDTVQDERFPATTEVINYYKEAGKGRDSMCDVVEKFAEVRVKESKIQLLYNLVRKGSLPKDEAIEESGVSAEEFDRIAASLATENK